MHGDIRLGGVLWVFLMVVLVIAVALALFVAVDSVRRGRNGSPAFAQRMLKFGILQIAFFALLALAQFRVLSPWLPALTALAAPLALAQGVSYLLRVVYPRPSAADAVADETPISV